MVYITIWDSIPPWGTPERLYILATKARDFAKEGKKLDERESNEFSEQLLRVIWLVFKPRRLEDKLRQIGADAEGIIQDCAMHLRKKIEEGKFELRASNKPESGLPLLSALKRATFLFMIDERKRTLRVYKNEKKATDEWGNDPEDAGMDSFTTPEECFDVERIAELKEVVEDECIGDIKCCSDLEQRRVEEFFSQSFNEITKGAKAPETKVSPEVANLIRSRIVRAIRSFAEKGF